MISQPVSIAAALALAVAPVAAQAAPDRVAAPMAAESEQLGVGLSTVVGLLVFGLIAYLFIEADNDDPASP